MTILSMLSMVTGVVGSVAMFPQAYRLFKRKSAKDISISSYLFLFITGIIWLLYGFEINNYPIIIPQLIGNIPLVSIIIAWILYGRETKENERPKLAKQSVV